MSDIFPVLTSTTGGSGYSMIIMLVVLVAVFYFMIIRPESKKKKEAEALRGSLKKGDNITTIGGIVGEIVRISEDSIVIETGEDQVRMELQKWSVMTNNSAEAEKKKQQEENRAAAKAKADAKAKAKADKKSGKNK